MSMDRFTTDFDAHFPEPECPAQLAVEGATHQRAAVQRPTIDRPASEWDSATRIAASHDLAHIFSKPGGSNV